MSGNRAMSRSGSMSAENERTVGATESKRVGQHVFQRHRTGVLGNVVEIAALTRMIQVDGRWRYLVAQCEHTENRLDRTGRAEQMSGHGFGGTHRQLVRGRAECAADGRRLGPI